MILKFTKMHGAGNDFVMIDDRQDQVPWEDHFFMASIASRRTGVGCEGVILIKRSKRADIMVRFFNPDGTEVDMCGNGSRCAAAFAHSIGATGKTLAMESHCGVIDAEVREGSVCVWMPEPSKRNYNMQVDINGTIIQGDYINTGVPHFVVQVPNIGTVNVQDLGKALRLHTAFAPEGTNVDFVTFRPPNRMTMRTYERGVEAESGACGTGAVASAIVGVETSKFSLPVKIKTASGYELVIDGDWRNQKCTGLTLCGPVKFVFSGEFDTDQLSLDEEIE